MVVDFLDEDSRETQNPPRSNHTLQEFSVGDIWMAYYPYFDRPGWYKYHPCIILKTDEGENVVLSIRTSHSEKNREYNYNIRYPLLCWRESGLNKPSHFVLNSVTKVDLSLFDKKVSVISKVDWVLLSSLRPDLHLQAGIGQ